MDFVGAATPLDPGDITAEAERLGVEEAAILAVCDVESSGSGFLPDGRPKILFEAKWFHTLTNGAYDKSHPNISSTYWNRSLYGPPGAHQYDRLAVAIGLDRDAALQSASWGKFQIMGSNYQAAGYPDVENFVQAMVNDEANHLTAFGNFCESNRITGYLIAHDWTHFTLRYNGPGNVANYAGKLERAYQRHLATNPGTPSTGPRTTLRMGDRGNDVLALQNQLIQLGYPITADGIFGQQTDTIVHVFQQQNSLIPDGKVGPKTQAAIDAAIAAIP